MARRITKNLSLELIQYAKRIDIKLNPRHKNSTSAFEFCRQMESAKLKKVNPTFECVLNAHSNESPPVVCAEFSDGSKWELSTSGLSAAFIREEFFTKAEEVEDAFENSGGKGGGSEEVVSKGKGGSKPAGKK